MIYQDGINVRTAWQVRSVQPLGEEWMNCFRDRGSDNWWFEPCPAMVVIERVGAQEVLDPDPHRKYGRFVKVNQEYDVVDTEAYFATMDESNRIVPAFLTYPDSYVGTIRGNVPPDLAQRKDIVSRGLIIMEGDQS